MTSDKTIDPKLLESAKKEFLEKGYLNASLKAICEGAGITTGALYKRYKGKEDLFSALVESAISDIHDVMVKKGSVKLSEQTDQFIYDSWQMKEDVMLWWYDFLYQRRDAFCLLLSSANGTKYADFVNVWVEEMTDYSYKFYKEAYSRGLASNKISKKSLHVMLSAYWTIIYEPFAHNFDWSEIKKFNESICKFINWNEALGLHLKK
ncbi:MAG: TetR/AcrR family transcriptional regulator [Treponema sp.]|nr:TetR/AcrR family transcriptional regulator [Treponema sp.]